MRNKKTIVTLAASLLTLTLAGCDSGHHTASAPEPEPAPDTPNILFIVLDDFGVDQLPVFGYGGATPPHTPNIDAIAHAGLRFRNAWSMPTCTPTRATFFNGQYPFRTDIRNAVVALDLANSQVSPFAYTLPKLLKEKGYTNAVIGKMHLSGSNLNPANHPLGDTVMHALGWDYFEGFLDGGPYPIDTTAGGVGGSGGQGPYSCGFVPATRDDPTHGADSGACYQADGSCFALSTDVTHTPGRSCLEQGGIFDPGKVCRPTFPSYLDFTKQNAYYTGEWVVSHPDGSSELIPVSHPSNRGYRSILETDRAVEWIHRQPAQQPWMLSLGYSAIHTPLQQPPESLLGPGRIPSSGLNCTNALDQRILTNQMIEALDTEIGRLLTEAGLARYTAEGALDYRPSETNTVVVIVGDNGTYAPSVKAPFNPTRAKGFPYQTGVWVPLIVAGPMVEAPGRTLAHMVNAVDMFSLFGEIAGIDVHAAVPESRSIDAQRVLPYLTQPDAAAIRTTNYTEMGANIQSINAEPAPPCIIPSSNVCVEVFPQQQVCEDQGGTWYGPGGTAGQTGLPTCCAVNEYLTAQGEPAVDILPQVQRAIRNDDYKLVQIERLDCTTGRVNLTEELYRVDQASPLPRLDNAIHNLLTQPQLTAEAQRQYAHLKTEVEDLLASHVSCPGDGNRDLVVNDEDIANWKRFNQSNEGRSSWYDFNHDGLTDETDLLVIQSNLGLDCRPAS